MGKGKQNTKRPCNSSSTDTESFIKVTQNSTDSRFRFQKMLYYEEEFQTINLSPEQCISFLLGSKRPRSQPKDMDSDMLPDLPFSVFTLLDKKDKTAETSASTQAKQSEDRPEPQSSTSQEEITI